MNQSAPRGILIAFEGGNGSGKSSQAQGLFQKLKSRNISCQMVREPGGTPMGEHLRNYLKEKDPISPYAEMLLFAAARAELVDEVIMPALDRGETIIADRFTGSSIAYQGFGRGIDRDIIAEVNYHATRGLAPDVTFLLDMPPGAGLIRRINARGGQAPAEGTRFEELDEEFHNRVRKGYLDCARRDNQKWQVLDATQSLEFLSGQITCQVWEMINRKTKLR